MIGFEYRAPDTLEEVCASLRELGDDARLIAGGTALVLLMKQRLVRPEVLVSLKHLADLKSIVPEDRRLRVGAMATHRQVENNSRIRQDFPALEETLAKVATPRVRNQGTLGGNLAHADPNQDPPATLVALNASVRLRSSDGQRTVPLDEFFSDYYETVIRAGEVLTDILLPLPAPNSGSAFLKFLPKTADDYATVAAAASLRLDNGACREVRVALGSAGPTPVRARAAESILEGQAPDDSNLRSAAAAVKDEVDPLTDVRGSAEYKRDMCEVFTYRALKRALERASSSEAVPRMRPTT
jgi:aerobic carbon-monoxide dehydrogenase medium subunit